MKAAALLVVAIIFILSTIVIVVEGCARQAPENHSPRSSLHGKSVFQTPRGPVFFHDFSKHYAVFRLAPGAKPILNNADFIASHDTMENCTPNIIWCNNHRNSLITCIMLSSAPKHLDKQNNIWAKVAVKQLPTDATHASKLRKPSWHGLPFHIS